LVRKKSAVPGTVMKRDREKLTTPEGLKTGSALPEEGALFVPLDRVGKNKRAKVIDIQGGWGLKKRMGQMGIHPGDLIMVVRYGPFGGPLVIEVHGFQLALGRGVASRIFVEEVAE
jgi:ferrous iron transport protein A